MSLVIPHDDLSVGLLLLQERHGEVMVVKTPPTSRSMVHVEVLTPNPITGKTFTTWVPRKTLAWA